MQCTTEAKMNPHLDALRAAYTHDTHKPFECPSGALKVANTDLILYYGKNKSTGIHRLDLNDASNEDLKELADYCDPASFGRNQEDVLDETYRSAGKLDVAHFSTSYDPGQSGIVEAIQDVLLKGHKRTGTGLTYELYKLNVYGPGQFFKAHKDTPRGEKMFASLVVVLPTKHEGGALIFRHEKHTFTFDSAATLAKTSEPSIAFVAFYSDIEHEVSPVTSGYRVTLTYNLYFKPIFPSPVAALNSAQELAIRNALRALMDDKDYLPNGGFVGFGLRHEYALSSNNDVDVNDTVKPFLKGSDAVLAAVTEELGLESSVWLAYKDTYDDEMTVLCKSRQSIGRDPLEIPVWDVLHSRGGLLLHMRPDTCHHEPEIKVQWATEAKTSATVFEENYVFYGNEATFEVFYGSLCFLIHLGPSDDRLSPLKVPEMPLDGWVF
ncbi:hypothetical protein BC835DRAFT_631282 [Cytidiella melzeri]|nr:hypothetical protein BC835DRAFT_631282 [Cytidiella melzeri]